MRSKKHFGNFCVQTSVTNNLSNEGIPVEFAMEYLLIINIIINI